MMVVGIGPLPCRLGSLTAWTGSERVQSPLNVFPDQWYHVASVLIPLRTGPFFSSTENRQHLILSWL